jgi:hypothetical protein
MRDILVKEAETFDAFNQLGSKQNVLVIETVENQPAKWHRDTSFCYKDWCAYSARAWQLVKNVEQGKELREPSQWAEDGFCTLEAHSEIYAAALMCTSADAVGFGDVHFPSKAIVFRFPTNLLDAEYARIDISMLGDVRLHVCGCSGRRSMHLAADTVDDLLFTPLNEGDEVISDGITMEDGSILRNTTSEEKRILILIRHYIAGLIIAYQVKSNWTYEGVRLSQVKKTRGVPPQHRYYVLGRKVRTDVREGVQRYVNGESHKSPSFQFVVRGHYRNQACGPNHSERRIIWIEPFWKPGKNPENKILVRSVAL